MAELTSRAVRDLDSLTAPLRKKADSLIEQLDTNPALGKKLKGKLEGKRSMSLGRTHRIIYTTAPLLVLTIVQRKDAYR